MTDTQRPARWRQLFALAATVLVAAVTLLATAGPAAAHATLVGTDPVEGTVLPDAPEQVTLTFSEPVRLTAQEITVYDAEGGAIDSETTSSGSEVTVALPGSADLADGTYVVGWYVVSADGHPISGSLTFSIGERSDEVAAPPAAPESSRVVDAAQGILHAVTYLGLLVAGGLAAFVALVLPLRFRGDRVRARLRSVVRVSAAVGIVGGLLLVPVASVYAQGLELTDLLSGFDPALVTNEVVFALLLVFGLGCLVVLMTDRPPGPQRRLALLGVATVAVVSPAAVGHTRAYQPELLLVGADSVHLLTGSAWLGGLLGLVLTLRALAGREELAAETLSRFSLVAGGLLVAVAVTGSLQAWRILASWSGFVDTTYGRLLLVKIGLVLVVAAVAGWNRYRLLPRVASAAGFADRGVAAGLVRRTVLAEATMLVALVGVTGFLVNQSPRPAPVEVPPGRTGVADGTLGELQVLVVMSPRERGPNTVLVQLQDMDGEPAETKRPPEVELRSGDLDLGSVPVTSVGAGTWRAFVLLPRAGAWEVQVSVRESKFENPVSTVRFDVR